MPQPDYIAWVPGTSEVWISKGHPREKKKTAPKIIVGFVIIITSALGVRQGNGVCCIFLKNQKNHWLNHSQEKMSHELIKTTIILQVF